MRREILAEGNFYHVYNRGVDKRSIFEEPRDHERFLISLFLFNDAELSNYDLQRINLKNIAKAAEHRSKKQLVDIIQYSNMPNHLHLDLYQRMKKGISAFMQRVGTGFTQYFNIKKNREGRLFQGTFKAKDISKDPYFVRLASYIPLNPLEILFPNWEKTGLSPTEIKRAKQWLKRYRWTSFNDYFDDSPLPGLVNKERFFQVFPGDLKMYEKYIDELLGNGLT